jgi:hypothetical protein
MQAHPFGNRSSGKILILDHVIDPCRLICGQNPSDQVDSGKQNRFPACLFELFDLICRNVPAAFNMQSVGVGVHYPQLAQLPVHRFADVLQQLRSRFRETERFG